MPKTREVVAMRHEEHRTRLHTVYTEALKGIAGANALTSEDMTLLQLIDKRLASLAEQRVKQLEQSWVTTNKSQNTTTIVERAAKPFRQFAGSSAPWPLTA